MCKTVQNQCNCGYATHPTRECICTPLQVRHYLGRVSGPLLDRIDLHVDVPAVRHRELAGEEGGERSAAVRERVIRARRLQAERFKDRGFFTNARSTKSPCAGFVAGDQSAAGQYHSIVSWTNNSSGSSGPPASPANSARALSDSVISHLRFEHIKII